MPVWRPGQWLRLRMLFSTLRDEQTACCFVGDCCWPCEPQVGLRTPGLQQLLCHCKGFAWQPSQELDSCHVQPGTSSFGFLCETGGQLM